MTYNTIHINIIGTKVSATADYRDITSGSVGLQAEFTFDSTWDNLTKTVVFTVGGQSRTVPLLGDGNMCIVPWEILTDAYIGNELYVAVTGIKGDTIVYPTVYGYIGKVVKSADDDADPSLPPSPSTIEIITAKADEAVKIASSVEKRADNGEFNGEKGDSAYKVAQLNGFTGTEEEWLASLHYDHSDEFTVLAEQVKADTAQSAENVLKSAENANQSAESASKAKVSETNAKTSETQSSQNLSDLLHTIGTSVPSLVDGKIPMSQIPATATTEIYRVNSADELVTLTAQKGDLAELVEDVAGEQTITKTWQLLGEDSTVRSNWVVWGTSYAVQAGSATIAETANNAERINGMRLVTMNYSDFETAVKDADTLYAVDMEV